MGPEDVAALLEREGSGVPLDSYDETSEAPDVRQGRTAALSPILDSCRELWNLQSPDLALIAQKIGDGSRDVAWRLPLGDSGILDLFGQVLGVDGLQTALYVHALRIVGNSCADTDENRARVIESGSLNAVISRLKDESLIPFTIPVLYNVLVDYEPAQLAASRLSLNQHLTRLLSSPTLTSHAPFVTYFCKILALLVNQEGEAAVANPDTACILLSLAGALPFSEDVEDFASLSSVAAAYLGHVSFQKNMLSEPHMTLLLNIFYHAHTAFQVAHLEDAEAEAALKQCRSSLLTAVSDISADDAFPLHHPLGSPISQTFFSWLQGPVASLKPAACLVLGNLSRSDENSTALVQDIAIHTPLISLLSDSSTSDPQTLHSALSFLKNLAIPVANKPLLGPLLEPSCIPRIFTLDTLPQVQFSAVSLTRLLLVNCPANVARVCSRLSKDESSPSYDRSSVHAIISIFERSDAEPTKLEAARSIAALCRVLHSNPTADILPEWNSEAGDELGEDGKRRNAFYAHHDLSKLLTFLVCQEKWPILRSEAWFVFALMCRSKDGGGVILTALFNDASTAALMKTVTGRDTLPVAAESQDGGNQLSSNAASSMLPDMSGLQLEPQQVNPQQMADMARVDRENGVVLCTEMVKHWGDEIPQLRLSMLQDLIKEGTELIARGRAQA